MKDFTREDMVEAIKLLYEAYNEMSIFASYKNDTSVPIGLRLRFESQYKECENIKEFFEKLDILKKD